MKTDNHPARKAFLSGFRLITAAFGRVPAKWRGNYLEEAALAEAG